jgi:hypothetical protein
VRTNHSGKQIQQFECDVRTQLVARARVGTFVALHHQMK